MTDTIFHHCTYLSWALAGTPSGWTQTFYLHPLDSSRKRKYSFDFLGDFYGSGNKIGLQGMAFVTQVGCPTGDIFE